MSTPLLPASEAARRFEVLQDELGHHGCTVELVRMELTRPARIKPPCFVVRMGGAELHRVATLAGLAAYALQLRHQRRKVAP